MIVYDKQRIRRYVKKSRIYIIEIIPARRKHMIDNKKQDASIKKDRAILDLHFPRLTDLDFFEECINCRVYPDRC